MKSNFISSLTAAALVAALAFAAGAQAQETMSPLVKQLYNGGWPDKASIEQLNKDRLYCDAILAYRMILPALNTIGMRDGSQAKFGKGYNVLPIWKDRMNAKCWVPTPNCDVIYSMSYLDLKETGPLVVYAPPDVIGMFILLPADDHRRRGHRTESRPRRALSASAAGSPGARSGGLLRLQILDLQRLPFLSHRDEAGCGRSRPHGSGGEGRDDTRLSAEPRRERAQADAVPQWLNIRVNMMYPTDFSYWEKLKAFVDYEPVESIAPEVRGILASIGVIKGVPFNPDAAEKEVLSKAVETAPKMIMARRLAGRADGLDRYYTDRRYMNAWAGTDAAWFRSSYLDVNQRASFFQVAYSSAPAMVMERSMRARSIPARCGTRMVICSMAASLTSCIFRRAFRRRLSGRSPSMTRPTARCRKPASPSRRATRWTRCHRARTARLISISARTRSKA